MVLAVVAVGLGLAYLDARRDQRRVAEEKVLAVATSIAGAPQIPAALVTADPSARLQPWAEGLRRDTGTDFIVIMSPAGIRFTHADPTQIGGRYRGTIEPSLRGETLVEQYVGTLGESVRAVAPVRDGDEVIALVSVGITTANIERSLWPSLPTIGLAALVVGGIGVLGTWAINRRLKRQTHGLGEREITRMFEYYDAVLHAVREGMVLLDLAGRVQLVNDEARRLLDLPEDVTGRLVADLGLPASLVAATVAEQPVRDEIHLAGARMLVLNRTEAAWQGRAVGTVITLRDHTELRAISGELDTVRGLADSLRSQNHEASNRLHTVVSLIEMGRPEQAVDFATRELDAAQRLTDTVVSAVDDPVVSAVLLGKSAQAAERGIELSITPDSRVAASDVDPNDMVTLLGNLIDNAMDATTETEPPRRVAVRVVADSGGLALVVSDSGPGLAPDQQELAFRRGWSTKPSVPHLGRGIGLALVIQTVRRLGGSVTVGRGELGGAKFSIEIGKVRP